MKAKIKDILGTFWALVRNVGFIFVILSLALVVFTIPDQADDFISSFIESPDPKYYVTVALLLIFWSYISWYSSSIIVDITPVDPINIQNLNTEKFNRFVAFLPFLILAVTFFQAAPEVQSQWRAVLIGLCMLVSGVVMMFYLRMLDKRNNEVDRKKWPDLIDILKHQNREVNGKRVPPTFRQEINFIKRYRNVLFYFRTIGIAAIVLLILFCIPAVLIPVTQFLRPASVIILSFSFITFVMTVLFYFHDVEARPFAVLIVVCLLLFSLWNDNTSIPTTQNIADIRLTPKQAFDKWYKVKCDEWKGANDTMPVVFIATQGGGIRGELWTIECLHKLSKVIPGFQNQIFCMGGASGGTVGAVYNAAFWFDTLHNRTNDKLTIENFITFAGTDCISPVTASFAFGENLQHFLPFPVCFLERSKIMMNAFSTAYKSNLNSSLIDSGLLKLYYPGYNKDSFDVRVPSLFINGVLAETGQRIITSNLKITESKNFESDIDFFDHIKADITVATASLNCMRFPLLLSGGLFYKYDKSNNKVKVGHLVDGGYRENTGLQAMYSLMCELHQQMKDYKVRPILLYLRNGNSELKDSVSSPVRLMHDIITPITALLNVNGTSVPALGIMKMIEQQKNIGNPMNMFTGDLWLNNASFKSEATFPLGLYMSDTAKYYLHARADSIISVDSTLIRDLRKCFLK